MSAQGGAGRFAIRAREIVPNLWIPGRSRPLRI